jgi:hypothetical protein
MSNSWHNLCNASRDGLSRLIRIRLEDVFRASLEMVKGSYAAGQLTSLS